jgi:chorismate dehydratase
MHIDKSIRIGAVTYLNTKPLVYGLSDQFPEADLLFDLPSRLADRLKSGELDVALIPSIETLQSDEYTIVSDACIACHGPVWSVRLMSRIPFDQIRTLSLDEGSRTSVALSKILFDLRFGRLPQTVPLPINQPPEQVTTDAVLIIGDRAMQGASAEFPYDWDLGEQWLHTTGLPFVFAMWTARKDFRCDPLGYQLSQARDRGVAHVQTIAEQHAADYGLSVEQCVRYLREHLQFELAQPQCEALTLFHQQAVRLGLAPPHVEISFYDCKTS